MRDVKPLSEGVRSSIRSGVIMYDVARVVEELVFNSLDAAATKVSVFVGIGTCYVKVVDNGCGITRDGLVLLGERYTTSKFGHCYEGDGMSGGSFGSRGEALASISDVALLEILTKVSGRPNGYHKVMKGSKCLYLGVDDDRKDVGTTVVVRDLFYNQPVRRKSIQSSPKMVLDSVKKSVHRIALVHSKVSFKVVDIESEDELLRTIPSPSPLALLRTAFGNEVSDALHELNISDGKLELFGYLSTPRNCLAIKAFQYFYVNSRFICKGPFHKLLNQLAYSFECWSPGADVSVGSHNSKRSRPQAVPAYVLNLSCPRSFYDLNFEPSKTHAEFKDWAVVLKFIEKSIQRFWKEKISCDFPDSELSEMSPVGKKRSRVMSPVGKKRSRIQDLETSPDIMKVLSKEDSNVSQRGNVRIPMELLQLYIDDAKGFKDKDSAIDFVHDTAYSFRPGDQSHAVLRKNLKRGTDSWMSDIDISLGEGYMLDSGCSASKRPISVEDHIYSPFKRHDSFCKGSTITGTSCYDSRSNMDITCEPRKPFLNSCSLQENLPFERDFLSKSGINCHSDFTGSKRVWDDFNNTADVSGIDGCCKRMRSYYNNSEVPDIWSMTYSPRTVSSAQKSKFDPFTEFEPLSGAYLNSEPTCTDHFKGSSSDMSDEYIGSYNQNPKSEWYSVTSNPLSGNYYLDFEPFSNEISVEGRYRKRHGTRDTEKYLVDAEEFDCSFGSDIGSKITEHCPTGIDWGLDYVDKAGLSKFLCQDKIDAEFYSGPASADETDWLCWHSHSKSYICTDMQNRHEEQVKYPDSLKSRVQIRRSMRSQSAPPFPRSKKKYSTSNYSVTATGKHVSQTFHGSSIYPEAGKMKDLCQPPYYSHQNIKTASVKDLLLDTTYEESQGISGGARKMQKLETFEKSKHSEVQTTAPNKEIISKNQDFLDSGTKWRNCCPQDTITIKRHTSQGENDILDISSGFLHLAADSLVPASISKNCLKDSRVLQQVDKKFIPVMAGQILAVIDQHAADERIRLEELRHKVLSGDGEVKAITFLDTEQELMLPEFEYQLLHNYAKPVKEWGWRCNIHAQDSGSFKRNLNILHRQPTVITLTGVPCILGVNLSDVDLMEFLQQLSDTDGSSTVPPAVLRILNSKACRGAIMFGDSLLPSECSLIVDELKQTSLCFQCAHGRPTTAPLVNLEVLHKQIAKVASLSLKGGSDQGWHGLYRHELSLESAQRCLDLAKS